MARGDRVRNKIRRRRGHRADEGGVAGPGRPARLTDVAVALLLAVADALALAGMSLLMFLAGMSHSEPPMDPSHQGQGIPFALLTLTWVIPVALAVSSAVHARLRMPITATVQGVFLAVGTVLAVGQTNMLLSFA